MSQNCPAKSLTSAVFIADGTMGQWDKYSKTALPTIIGYLAGNRTKEPSPDSRL